jgi:glycopeptide antibiotics resistance protein
MAKRIILLFWIVMIVFPIAGLGWLYPGLLVRFNTVLRSNAAHVVMHAALFAGLALLLMVAFNMKPGRRAMAASILVVLVVAVLQEWLQALTQGFFPLLGALYDLGVDFLGGVVGYGVYVILRSKDEFKRG